MKCPCLILIFLFFLVQGYSQEISVSYLDDPGNVPVQKVIDITHLSAELFIDPYDTLVQGSVTFAFQPILHSFDSVVFWSPDIQYTSVEIEGLDIDYVKNGDNLIIKNRSPKKEATERDYLLKMTYTSKPAYDLFFIGWNEPAERPNKQIWAHRPFHWLPFYHDRLTSELRITFLSDYQVFSNGIRIAVVDNPEGTKTWTYVMEREHPFFSTALVIGKYDYLEFETAGGLPLELWYYPWQDDHAEPTYRYTAQMFDFFEEEFGLPYPYELYREAPVEDYLYGAMETTTSTVFGDYLHVDERAWDLRNYVNVNAHELAHQWYGNCLSHLRPADVWLTESFATYYAKMFEKEVFGQDYYENVRRIEFEETLEASKKDGYGVGHSRGGRARWYPKGSLVLDMMRDILGEEGFKASMKLYTNKNAFSEVETPEFLSAIYEATGQSLGWFFEQWIYRGGEPAYEVSWRDDISNDGHPQVIITVRQTHKVDELIGLFNMPIHFEVHFHDGQVVSKKQWIGEAFNEVVIPVPEGKKVAFVLFDPGERILKTVSFQKSVAELTAQALGATHMIDRYRALVALRDMDFAGREDFLMRAWQTACFHLDRGEIVGQMIKSGIDVFDEIIIRALEDSDPMVRRAVIAHTKMIPARLQEDYEKRLHDFSYVNVEIALALLARSFPENIPAYLEETQNETGWRGRNIRMKWLEIAIGAGNSEPTRELTGYCSPHFEFETRINAFYLLKRLNYLDEITAGYLIDGYLYWNYKVSNAAKDVLSFFYQQNRGKALINQAIEQSSADPLKLSQLTGHLHSINP